MHPAVVLPPSRVLALPGTTSWEAPRTRPRERVGCDRQTATALLPERASPTAALSREASPARLALGDGAPAPRGSARPQLVIFLLAIRGLPPPRQEPHSHESSLLPCCSLTRTALSFPLLSYHRSRAAGDPAEQRAAFHLQQTHCCPVYKTIDYSCRDHNSSICLSHKEI